MDIKLAEDKAFPFMVLYFTGSKDYTLSIEGLYDRAAYNEIDKGAQEENDIIRHLGMPIMSLQERDI